MSDDSSISVVNLGKLAKPADTLIKKVSSAVGGIFEPWQIERVAKADAKADLVKAKSEIEITDLHRRAMHRFVEEEALRQDNMENITNKALPSLNESSDPSKMEDDWVTNFFDKSRIVSDEEMQNIWANVLAGEANAPGTYSKRTVSLLCDLDKRDAELFLALCGFAWNIDRLFIPLIFDTQAGIYNHKNINFETLTHLDSIGLLQFNDYTGFKIRETQQTLKASYCGRTFSATMQNKNDQNLDVGKVMLTQVGIELAGICKITEIDGFVDYVKEQWSKKTFLTIGNNT